MRISMQILRNVFFVKTFIVKYIKIVIFDIMRCLLSQEIHYDNNIIITVTEKKESYE